MSIRFPKGATRGEDIRTIVMLDTGANTRNYIDATLAKQLIDAGAVASDTRATVAFGKIGLSSPVSQSIEFEIV